ncbi:MAG: hypothetical protein MUQ65_16100 [Armatimonadetes bacterium]|nr:hypothetical protein [Armatimonadota bacterium]
MGLQEVVRNGFKNAFGAISSIKGQVDKLSGAVEVLSRQGVDEIDQIEGRHISYWGHGEQLFTIAQQGIDGQAISIQISQDGPFVWTHYPVVLWRPTAPAGATLFGVWRPVTHFPLVMQGVDAGAALDLNSDIVSISWRMSDGGSQRNFQAASLPPLFSHPYQQIPLPKRVLFTPNSVITFTPTYRRIAFNNAVTPATEGNLEVMLPGFRIVNM